VEQSRTSQEGDCPDVVVGKEESDREEDTNDEKSAHESAKGSGSGKLRRGLFSHIGHDFRKTDKQRQQLDLALGVNSFRLIRSQLNERNEDEHKQCSV
jgi:hypothetical protein